MAIGATWLTGTTAAGDEDGEAGEESEDGNRTIGGGEGYNRTVDPSEADHTIRETEDLRPVLEDEAESGDVVYIDPDAKLVPTDVSYSYADNITVPEGVTLASNRGIDGADGGHVHADLVDDREPWPVFDLEAGVRVTGLRLSGPQWDWYEGSQSGMGIRVLGPDTEIDNCEIWGFSHAAIGKGHPDFYGNFAIDVHNNYIHHNPRDGLGYGVATAYDAHDMVEYNRFENNRHAIAAENGQGGYTARFNHVVGEALAHHFDVHRPGGNWIHIYKNTFEPVDNVWDDHKEEAVSIRGVPEDEAWIHHNWFHNPDEPISSEEMAEDEWTDEAITQAYEPEWQNVRYKHNHYGSDEPKNPSIGAPTEDR